MTVLNLDTMKSVKGACGQSYGCRPAKSSCGCGGGSKS